VVCARPVQAFKISAVMGKHRPPLAVCPVQDFAIFRGASPVILRPKYIMAESAEFLDGAEGEVLIGVKVH